MHSRISSVLARPMLRNFLTAFVLVFAMGAFAYIMRAQQEQGAMPEAQATSVSGVTSSNKTFNPLQVALLHWYDANLVGEISLPNAAPFGMAFDGSNMWIASQGVGVFKVRASDAAILGQFAVEDAATVAFDGANVWVAVDGLGPGSTVVKLRASDGAQLGSFDPGGNKFDIVFDGSHIWVTEADGSVSKLRATDGVKVGNFKTGSFPFALACDGPDIWVADRSDGTVTKLRASDGVKLATVTGLQGPAGLAFDGTNIWVSELTGNSVAKIAGNGTVRGTFPVAAAPLGLTFDGANIWVASVGSSTLTKLRASDGANLGAFPVGATMPTQTARLAFDGAHVWASLNDGNVAKF